MACCVWCSADNYFMENSIYNTNKQVSQKRVLALADKMKSCPKGSVVSYEPYRFIDYPEVYHLDAMLATQMLNLKCINAYTTTTPEEYSAYLMYPDNNSRALWLKARGHSCDSVFVVY